MVKQIETAALRKLIFERVACVICHMPFGRVSVGPTMLNYRHRNKGGHHVQCWFGAVCIGCFNDTHGLPIASDRKPLPDGKLARGKETFGTRL